LLLFIHGINGRSIGGISPNHIGKIALVAAAFSILLTKNQRLFVLAASFAVMLLVSSRSAVFAGVILVLSTEILLRGAGRALRIAVYIVVAVVVVQLVTAILSDSVGLIIKVVSLVFKLSDPERGIGSGVSGRATFWANGFLLFLKSPIIGLGFRTRESASLLLGNAANAHEGYLNILIDTGLVGFFLLMCGIFGTLWMRIKMVGRLRRQIRTQPLNAVNADLIMSFRLNVIIASFILANLGLWTIEPDTINLALVSSAVFFILIAAPREITFGHRARRNLSGGTLSEPYGNVA
jgi:O-antigen ligase